MTATAERIDPVETLEQTSKGVVDVVDTTLNVFSPIARGIAHAHPLTRMFGSAAEIAPKAMETTANWAMAPLHLIYDSAVKGIETLKTDPVKLLEGNESTKPLADVINGDPALKDALETAIEKDPTLAPVILKMFSNEEGATMASSFAKTLRSPEVRGDLTLGLQNMAESDTITGKNLEETFSSLSAYSAAQTPENKARVVSAYQSMGLTEQDADEMIAEGQKAFWENILNEPERLGGFIGNMAAKFFGENAGNAIAAAIPGIINALGNIPEFISGLFSEDDKAIMRDLKENTIDPAISGSMSYGAQNRTMARNFDL